jgi:hypothetical protein
MESEQETCSKLKFIGYVQTGQKLNTKSLIIQDNTLFTRISRTFLHQDDRNNTLQFTRKTIMDAFCLLEKYIGSKTVTETAHCQILVSDLRRSMDGISCIKKTYEADKFFVSELETLQDYISSRLKEIQIAFPSYFPKSPQCIGLAPSEPPDIDLPSSSETSFYPKEL